MNGIALREIHLTNKMMMMMIVMVSASILLNHDGWNATVTVCPMFSTFIERMNKNSLSPSRFYDNAFIILVKGVVYDVFVTNHSVQASLSYSAREKFTRERIQFTIHRRCTRTEMRVT